MDTNATVNNIYVTAIVNNNTQEITQQQAAESLQTLTRGLEDNQSHIADLAQANSVTPKVPVFRKQSSIKPI